MSALDQAAVEKLDKFRISLLQYKNDSDYTYEELSSECEQSRGNLCKFVSGRKNLSNLNLLKVIMATGLAL